MPSYRKWDPVRSQAILSAAVHEGIAPHRQMLTQEFAQWKSPDRCVCAECGHTHQRQNIVREFDTAIELLGGNKAAAKKLALSSAAISTFRRAGKFPPKQFKKVQYELAIHGWVASVSLFGFD